MGTVEDMGIAPGGGGAGAQPPALPLVSVIIPAFNCEATLPETLRSVAAQTYSNLEILIVDDGSTDGTIAAAIAFCAADPRARLLAKSNGGVASARNAGLAAANGTYIAPLDSDDLWHPEKIARQVAAAVAAPEPPGFVYCWFRHIDSEGRVVGAGETHQARGHAFGALLYRNFVGNGSGLLLERAAALEAGGYDESLRAQGVEGCEDILLQIRVARRRPVEVVPEYLVGYRVGRGRMSCDAERMFQSWRTASREAAAGSGAIARARRWNLAWRQVQLAEQRAIRGNWLGTGRLLVSAALLDPVRTSALLTYRSLRALDHRLRRVPPPRPGAHFLEWDPATEQAGEGEGFTRFARRLAALDTKRMQRLAAGAAA